MKIYLDSNVLISAFKIEIGFKLRGLFVEANNFLEFTKEHNYKLVISSLVFYEIRKILFLSKQEVQEKLNLLEIEYEEVEMLQDDSFGAKKFEKLGIHSPDSKHIAIAIRTKCDCIVTFNLKDFEKANNLIEVKEPSMF